MTDLIFDRAPPSGPPWPLVFGDEGDDSGIATLYGSADLPAVQVQGRSRAGPPPLARMAGDALTGGWTLSGASLYANNVARPAINRTASHWQIAAALPACATPRHQRSQPCQSSNTPYWQNGAPLAALLVQAWAETQHAIRPWAVLPQQDAQRLPAPPLTATHQQADPAHWLGALPHQEGIRIPVTPLTQRHQDGLRNRRLLAQTHHQQAQPLPRAHRASAGAAITLAPGALLRHQAAMRAPAGVYVRPIAPPVAPPCYLPNGLLTFDGLRATDGLLLFLCEREGGAGPQPGPTLVIPILKVYMTTHTLEAVLLPGDQTVTLLDVQLSADADNPGWSLSATGPESLLDQLGGTGAPKQIQITLDGLPWVFAIERLGRTRNPGQRRVQVTASSVTQLLGAPYLPAQSWLNAQDASAQQLVIDALQNTGVDLDWQIPDWLVSAGAWSFTGTPLAAALRVAQAAGAVVQSDRVAPLLRFLPRYPLMPWEWADARADVAMPSAAITTDSLERGDQPAWEAVYVMGTNQGVMTRVKRTGTAGALLAPQIADDLITHVDAARQRGRAILGAGGRQASITLSLPLLAGAAIGQNGPGLLQVGQLLEVSEPVETWRALVRGVRLSASFSSGQVRQSLRVERHF